MSETEAAQPTTDGAQLAGMLDAAQESQPADTDNTEAAPAPDGTERVDLSGLDDNTRTAIEARFAHLSKLMRKQEERATGRVSEWQRLAEEQAKHIEELQNGVGQVVDHLQDKSLNDAEAKIMQDMAAAHEAGDTSAYLKAQRELTKIEVRREQMEERKKQAQQNPRKERTQQPGYRSATEMANAGVSDGDINSDEARAIGAWQNETGDDGQPLRPWAHSRNQTNPTADPVYRRALIEAAAVFDEASPWASKTVAEKLAEVDRRMGVKKTTGQQNVMPGGSLTTPRKSSTIVLDPDIQKLAVRMKLAGPKASDAENIEAYRKQIQLSKAKKGAR